ncbi:hypothetical protein [Argonema galeatum]|uniref:hypothetical protein n=1 Tax=Argonema galeatum TaxID=2942762 RepID=UPI00201315CE|nr:hypothetical protein [Argonema galeatum]MCL1467451.1 hypothetical protein [Argonema galeatum A003/A1]
MKKGSAYCYFLCTQTDAKALPYLVCQIISFLVPYTLAGWDFKAIVPKAAYHRAS